MLVPPVAYRGETSVACQCEELVSGGVKRNLTAIVNHRGLAIYFQYAILRAIPRQVRRPYLR
jgi:hypothetical protein